jgi:hypothetical protein
MISFVGFNIRRVFYAKKRREPSLRLSRLLLFAVALWAHRSSQRRDLLDDLFLAVVGRRGQKTSSSVLFHKIVDQLLDRVVDVFDNTHSDSFQ